MGGGGAGGQSVCQQVELRVPLASCRLTIYIISLFIHTLKYNAVHKYTVLRWI